MNHAARLSRQLMREKLRALLILSVTAVAAVLLQIYAAAAGAENVIADVPARARIDFVIRIPEVLQLKLLEQPALLEVTEADASRGFVDAFSVVQVVSNSRQGFGFRIDLASPAIASAQIEGLGQRLRLQQDGAAIRLSHHGRAEKRVTYKLNYRLYLTAGSQAGRYQWPVQVSVSG